MNTDVVNFDVIYTPADDGTLQSQVRHALSLGLPEIRDFEYPWGDEMHIVANGPTARNFSLEGKTAAINGALKLFTAKGLAPTYWLACDPQEKVVDFLETIPEETIYLVCSKCHASVFERLKDRTVILWHIDEEPVQKLVQDRDPLVAFASVTTCAFELLARMGWRKLHTWGWDGCVIGEAQHAVGQGEVIGGPNMPADVDIDGVKFTSTTCWVNEAQDAVTALKGFPFRVTIHGGGMFGAWMKAFLPPRVTLET